METSRFHKKTLNALFPVSLLASMAILFSAAPAVATPTCTQAGSTGLTTLITATSGQSISHQKIDATGCDIGVYVPPFSTHVSISHDSIWGAGIHGVFVQDSSWVTVDHNTVTGNSGGVPALSCDFIAPPCVNEGKAIQLSGTSDSVVSHNTVTQDLFGGIAVTDDGLTDPGAPNPGNAMNANNNVVDHNTISEVSNDCGIVIAVYNPQSADNNVVSHNDVYGDAPPFGVNPYVGQIVVATDGPFATITNTVVDHNTIAGSTLPGIVVHSNAPGDLISGTVIDHNALSNNGYYPVFFSTVNTPVAADGPTGISLVAEGPYAPAAPNAAITDTTLSHNSIKQDTIGVWICMTSGTVFDHTPSGGSSVTTPVAQCANGGD